MLGFWHKLSGAVVWNFRHLVNLWLSHWPPGNIKDAHGDVVYEGLSLIRSQLQLTVWKVVQVFSEGAYFKYKVFLLGSKQLQNPRCWSALGDLSKSVWGKKYQVKKAAISKNWKRIFSKNIFSEELCHGRLWNAEIFLHNCCCRTVEKG